MPTIVKRHQRSLIQVWSRVQEPRLVSLFRFVMYLLLLFGGSAAVIMPPTSLKGQIGERAMLGLAVLLLIGGVLGGIAALPGAWWLERIGLLSVTFGLTIYLYIILTLHITESGNRLLQFSIVASLIVSQAIRWVRIKDRPYDSDLRTFFIDYDHGS